MRNILSSLLAIYFSDMCTIYEKKKNLTFFYMHFWCVHSQMRTTVNGGLYCFQYLKNTYAGWTNDNS